jgi:ferredoxin
MPTVTFRETEIECASGAVLRDVLLEAGLSPHNGAAGALNCRGHGSCGTCAVGIRADSDASDEGSESPVSDSEGIERVRLSVPPHDSDTGLRLACQTRVYGDITVKKYPGFWGHHTDDA